MKRALMSSMALIIIALALQAQDIRVSSAPDTSVILIGDQVRFTVTARVPAGLFAELSGAADTLAGKIIILRRDQRDTTPEADGSMTIIDRYLITAFDTGSYTIPPFYAEVAKGDSLLRFYSDFSFIDVIRPDITPSDTTDVIFDIVPPRDAPVSFAEVLPWLVILLISAVIVYLLARYLPRNPLRRFVKPLPPPVPAHITAMTELQALKEEQLWQKGEIKEYYSRLSDIIRRYIDNRFGISSPELTTDETVRLLHRAAVTSPGQMALVKEVLSLSDMVKFAKYIPEGEVNESMFENAVRFVEETREPDVAAGADQSAGTGGSASDSRNMDAASERHKRPAEKGGSHA